MIFVLKQCILFVKINLKFSFYLQKFIYPLEIDIVKNI